MNIILQIRIQQF